MVRKINFYTHLMVSKKLCDARIRTCPIVILMHSRDVMCSSKFVKKSSAIQLVNDKFKLSVLPS